MKLLKSFYIVLGLALAVTAANSQTPSKILAQANRALGGEKALKAVTSWRRTGKITRISDGATGTYTETSAAGDLYSLKYDLNGFEVENGFNGKSGWIRDSKDGLRTMTGDAATDFQAETLYRNTGWLRAKDQKAKLTTGGTANLNGRSVNVIFLITAKAFRIKLYFDSATGLLLREEIPNGLTTSEYDFSDHKMTNGILTPYTIKYKADGEAYDVKVDKVEYNQSAARSTFDFPKLTSEPLPNIPALLEEIRANAAKVADILENYNYTETRIDRDLNSDGDFIQKSSEKRLLTFYKGNRISRTIEKNGRPLSASDQAKEDKDIEKQVAEIEKKIAEKERKLNENNKITSGGVGQPKDEGQRITIADALKGSLLINPRRERFRGRNVIVFDYEPDPAFKPQTRNEKLFALCTGAVWVDVMTKQVVRLDAVLTKSTGNFIAKAKRGASFSLENELVNNEIWLPSQADINLSIKILFFGIDINNLIKYGEYNRFETDVRDVKVGDQSKP
ncbi:MAG: hypothetical protein ABIV48_03305 [Pyrinomonadaceae bacterium]